MSQSESLKDTAAVAVYKLFLSSTLGAVVLLMERRPVLELALTVWLSEYMSEQMKGSRETPLLHTCLTSSFCLATHCAPAKLIRTGVSAPMFGSPLFWRGVCACS